MVSTVVVNGHSFLFQEYKEAVTYVMNLAMSHHRFSGFETLKENLNNACDLCSEFLLNYIEEAPGLSTGEKTSLKRQSTKFLKSKTFLEKARTTTTLMTSYLELMLSYEGKGLLPGFGFGDKQFGDVLRGNSERISLTKVDR